jgi:NDMA-dependent alcohol dehydrogenase
VRLVKPGDPVVLSWIPDCGHCYYCMSGKANLCDGRQPYSDGTLGNGIIRFHHEGRRVRHFNGVSSFSQYAVVPERGAIPIDPRVPLDKAALIGCGVPTGWGSSMYAADMQLGDTVVIFGVGGVGMNAVQGARHRGAKNIIVVDPVAYKRERAPEFGATHTAETAEQAAQLVAEMTNGQGADRVLITVGVAHGSILEPAQAMTRRGGTVVLTAAAPVTQRDVEIDLFTFAMSGKRLQGTLYGSTNSRNDIPLIADLYRRGEFKLDELVTRTYSLEDINTAFRDLREGKNIRGVILYD